jgi:hypothetical protein
LALSLKEEKGGKRSSLVSANQKEGNHLTDEYLKRKRYFAGPINLDYAQFIIVIHSDLSSTRSTMMRIETRK